jgi:hypothetical protein
MTPAIKIFPIHIPKMSKKKTMENCPPLVKIEIEKIKDEERETSNKLYAIKLVEKIVFGGVALILVAVATALISLVVKSIK